MKKKRIKGYRIIKKDGSSTYCVQEWRPESTVTRGWLWWERTETIPGGWESVEEVSRVEGSGPYDFYESPSSLSPSSLFVGFRYYKRDKLEYKTPKQAEAAVRRLVNKPKDKIYYVYEQHEELD